MTQIKCVPILQQLSQCGHTFGHLILPVMTIFKNCFHLACVIYVKIWRVNKIVTGLVNIHYRACDIFVTSLCVIRIRRASGQIWISSTSTSSRRRRRGRGKWHRWNKSPVLLHWWSVRQKNYILSSCHIMISYMWWWSEGGGGWDKRAACSRRNLRYYTGTTAGDVQTHWALLFWTVARRSLRMNGGI